MFLQSDTMTKWQGRMVRTSQSNRCYLGVGTRGKDTDGLSVSALALFGCSYFFVIVVVIIEANKAEV